MFKNYRRSGVAAMVVASVLTIGAQQASAKCNITLKFRNNNASKITMLGAESQARVNGGTWSKMNFQDVSVDPGQTVPTSWKTNMSCNGNSLRDLRLKYRDTGDNIKYTELYEDHDFDDGDTVTIDVEH